MHWASKCDSPLLRAAPQLRVFSGRCGRKQGSGGKCWVGACQSFAGLSWEASTLRIGFLFKLAVLVNGGREARSLSRQQAARAGRTHLSTQPGRASGGCSRPGVPRQQLRSSRAPRHSKPHTEKPRCFPGRGWSGATPPR